MNHADIFKAPEKPTRLTFIRNPYTGQWRAEMQTWCLDTEWLSDWASVVRIALMAGMAYDEVVIEHRDPRYHPHFN